LSKICYYRKVNSVGDLRYYTFTLNQATSMYNKILQISSRKCLSKANIFTLDNKCQYGASTVNTIQQQTSLMYKSVWTKLIKR